MYSSNPVNNCLDVLTYGFGGTNASTSQWHGKLLPGNSLNIEPFLVPYQVLSKLNLDHNFKPAWVYENRIYSLQDVQDNGACKTLGEVGSLFANARRFLLIMKFQSFQWGFSYIQLFIVVVILFTWTSGTCVLRYRTHRFPPLQDQPERPRGVRALLLLAGAIESELEASGIDPHKTTDKQLNRHIYKDLKGGSTSFGFPQRSKNAYGRPILHWVKHNLGWFVIAIGLGVTLFLYIILFLVPLFIAILSAYLIGTTRKSRLFLAAIQVIIFSPAVVLVTCNSYHGISDTC